ncbi:hypothetical protein SELMODRAFT_419154 [Selaginella moellendorffii]|uniref:Uncharacterized protein n=1 Tax=Selaginella moellendorffii TaxID=88036 RepID=D8S812_SELML|nr:hypothetical protein SELMODRAFT_419154 [Selaginella moellendorffii]
MLASMLLQRAHGIPSAAISTIAPVRIGDLEPESRAVGRVLHGFLAADALMIDGSVQVLTMLEDSSGESVLLAIKHPMVSNASEVEVRAKFPRGSRSRRWCGRWTIWARSRRWSRGFSAIQGWIQGPTGPSRLTIPRTSRCSLSLARISSMDFKVWAPRGSGWKGTSSSKTRALRLLLKPMASGAGQDDRQNRVLALSNQAECYLKLGAALEMDPSHLKSVYRKALVLLKLHLYDWLCQLLRDFAGTDQTIDQLFEKSQKLARQSRDSSSVAQEISNSCRPWSDSNSETKVPELADYVGPLLSLVCEVAGDEREVPGMETFRPNWTTAEDWPICSTDSSGREALEGIEVKRTFEIVTKASYHPSSSRGFVYLATWILPTIPAFQTSAKRTLER